MLKVEFTEEIIFGFDGPNLCFLGNEKDFDDLAKSILDLTGKENVMIGAKDLSFISIVGTDKNIFFSSKKNGNSLACFDNLGQILFELDKKCWDRIFKFFVLESWAKRTDYLNSNESALSDFALIQECNFICSSEF